MYLTQSSVLTQGILRSQVAHLLKRMAEAGEFRFVLVTAERSEDLKRRDDVRRLRQELHEAGVHLVILRKLLPKFLRVHSEKEKKSDHLVSFALDFLFLILATGYLVLRYRVRVIHARSYIPGLVGLFYKRIFGVRLLWDPRGLIPEELSLARGWGDENWRYRTWKRLERRLLAGSSTTLVLSRPFGQHYEKIHPRGRYVVTPCCVDTEMFRFDPDARGRRRGELRAEGRSMVVFSLGCYVPYQGLETALEIFREIHSLRPEWLLLIMTPDADEVRRAVVESRISEEDFRVCTASFGEMPGYLSTADLALLVRVRSVVSEVASPVKFAEYLACGLPVVATPGIGETEAVLRKFGAGIVVDPQVPDSMRASLESCLAQSTQQRAEVREGARTAAVRVYSWDNYLSTYRMLYK
ncbi:MAG: glycosyltransferase [bacterium]